MRMTSDRETAQVGLRDVAGLAATVAFLGFADAAAEAGALALGLVPWQVWAVLAAVVVVGGGAALGMLAERELSRQERDGRFGNGRR